MSLKASVLSIFALIVVVIGISSPQLTSAHETLPAPAPSSAAVGGVLYNQNNNAAPSPYPFIPISDFEAMFNNFDSEGADDFVVPANGWIVDGFWFDAQGGNLGVSNGTLRIYNDSAGKPGTTACSPTIGTITARADDNIEVELATPCQLSAGTYWVGLRINRNLTNGQNFFWSSRSVTSNNRAVWRNPGNGYSTGCTTWQITENCASIGSGADTQDLLFVVYGTPMQALVASAVCNGDNLNVTISAGDAPFTISGTGPDLPVGNITSAGTTALTGPGTWTGVTVTEGGGNGESVVLGDFDCVAPPPNLDASAVCSGDNLEVTISDGDASFTISGTGPNLPYPAGAIGTYSLTGPAAWTGVTVTENGGDGESVVLGDFACASPSSTLNASAVCSGDDLVVTILTGNAPFTISGTGTDLPLAAATTGIYTFSGPNTWTGLTVSEDVTDFESILLGDFDCVAPVVIPPTPPAQPGINVPNLGVVAIYAHAPIRPYGTPDKEQQAFALPHDSDGNGFDTYTVTATSEVEGETWIALFNGTANWLWVPYDAVQVLVPIRGLN